MVIKKAQKGTKLTKVVSKPTLKESKNLKDATQMKNMRPVFKDGGSMSKCKTGCK